jgi:hypothetical protein
MSAKTVNCPECGLEARVVPLDGKVTLRFNFQMMQDRCTEARPSPAPLYPQLFEAAEDAGVEIGASVSVVMREV